MAKWAVSFPEHRLFSGEVVQHKIRQKIIEAKSCMVVDGCLLCFSNEDDLIHIFASGHWIEAIIIEDFAKIKVVDDHSMDAAHYWTGGIIGVPPNDEG